MQHREDVVKLHSHVFDIANLIRLQYGSNCFEDTRKVIEEKKLPVSLKVYYQV